MPKTGVKKPSLGSGGLPASHTPGWLSKPAKSAASKAK